MTAEHEGPQGPRATGLTVRALREALATAPGWSVAAGHRQLRHDWKFQSKEDAAAFVVMAVALCFERRALPDLSWFGLTVTVHLADPGARGITLRLVEAARLVSALAGPTVGNRSQPRTGILRWLIEQARELGVAGGAAPAPPEPEEKP